MVADEFFALERQFRHAPALRKSAPARHSIERSSRHKHRLTLLAAGRTLKAGSGLTWRRNLPRLTLSRKDWLDAIAFGATHFKAYLHQLVTLESEGRSLLFVTRNGAFPIAAAGTWPSPVKLRAAELRRRPWDFLPDAALTLTFDGERVTIGTASRIVAVPAKPA